MHRGCCWRIASSFRVCSVAPLCVARVGARGHQPRVGRREVNMATNTEVLSLHRYFGWAGHMRYRLFDRLRETAGNEQNYVAAHFVEPYLPYWCAGMYTLVEGWKRLGLQDPRVDDLLDADHLKVLESFRHGVYHFHPEYYDQK